MVTTQFFGIKIARYMREHGISAAHARPGRREGLPQRRAQPRTPGAAKPITADEIARLGHGQRPADPLHVLLPRRGRRGASSSPATPARPQLGGAPVTPARRRPRAPGASARSRSSAPSIQGTGEPTSVSADAAAAAFEAAGVGPGDVDVAQLQDTESGAEIMHMAECGFCERRRAGEADRRRAQTEIGGRLPVNTDGGCIANGEPIGASGLRQVHEIVTQLRGEAGDRQVAGRPRLGFTHVYGAPGHQRLHGARRLTSAERIGPDDVHPARR